MTMESWRAVTVVLEALPAAGVSVVARVFSRLDAKDGVAARQFAGTAADGRLINPMPKEIYANYLLIATATLLRLASRPHTH